MFDRLNLTEDLLDCRGRVLAPRGTVLSAESIAEAARRAPSHPRRALEDTALADEADRPLDDRGYRHLFPAEVRDGVRRALRSIRLPDLVWEQLEVIRREAPHLHVHGFVTAAVAVRMLLSAVSRPPGAVSELAAAALLHDVGMSRVPERLLRRSATLGADEAARIASHPLVGAYLLAALLGAHPAVLAARAHHWRCGQGYPILERSPSRSIEVIAVASTFAALTQPRPFREIPYDARGALDVLVREAASKQADGNTVKLLAHALRGGSGDPRAIRFGRDRAGHGPEAQHYVHVAPPSRSPV